jgi:hypothetical protein
MKTIYFSKDELNKLRKLIAALDTFYETAENGDIKHGVSKTLMLRERDSRRYCRYVTR